MNVITKGDRHAVNIGSFDIHDFRHSYATHLAITTGDIHYVSEQLGHESTSVTQDIYGHLIKNNRDMNIERMANYYKIA